MLRAVAVLLVVVHHAKGNLITWGSPLVDGFYSYFQGAVGVDLFFVISGFVISRQLLPLLSGRPWSESVFKDIVEFWVRRFWRLIPAAWFWLLALLLLTVFFNGSDVFGSVRNAWGSVLAGVLQVANFRFGECFMQYNCGKAFVYWSLSLEEQFYLVLPVLVVLCGRYFRWALLAIIVSQYLFPQLSLPFYLRIEALFLGVAIGMVSQTRYHQLMAPTFLGRPWVAMAGTAVLVILLATVLAPDLHIVNRFYQFKLVALVGALIVLPATYDRGYIYCGGVFRSLLVAIGDRSYSIYLVHIPAFLLIREVYFRFDIVVNPVSGASVLAYFCAAMLMVALMTEFSFRCIENRFRKRGPDSLAEGRGRAESEHYASP